MVHPCAIEHSHIGTARERGFCSVKLFSVSTSKEGYICMKTQSGKNTTITCALAYIHRTFLPKSVCVCLYVLCVADNFNVLGGYRGLLYLKIDYLHKRPFSIHKLCLCINFLSSEKLPRTKKKKRVLSMEEIIKC